jgi:putative flippase GtrA
VASPQIPVLRRWALAHWPQHREKVMYLLVGGWNAFVWYAGFALLYYLLHQSLQPWVILVLAYAIATMNGYLAFRYLVFTPVRHPVVEYLRYQAVYLPILALNLVALPVALSVNISAYVVQPVCGVVALVAAYIGNKYFTFRKHKVAG